MTADKPHLAVSIDGAIATFTFDRPEVRNALGMQMRNELVAALHTVERDASVRVVVLQGRGAHFLSGGDVKAFSKLVEAEPEERRQAFLQRIHDLHPVLIAMRRLPKPIVACVRGAAAGAGVSLAVGSDLVIAAESAYFTLAYCHLGTTPDGSATYSLPRAIGVKKAMEMTLLGDRFTAQQARDMGLINFVAPDAELEAQTQALAKRLANGPTRAYGRAKRLLYQSIERDFEAQLQAEAEAFSECAAEPDFQEGVRAFMAKRKAEFSG